jgi:hypothetical protein
MKHVRLDREFAGCIEEWGWKYHHSGIPTTERMPDERSIPHLKFYPASNGCGLTRTVSTRMTTADRDKK